MILALAIDIAYKTGIFCFAVFTWRLMNAYPFFDWRGWVYPIPTFFVFLYLLERYDILEKVTP